MNILNSYDANAYWTLQAEAVERDTRLHILESLLKDFKKELLDTESEIGGFAA